MANMSQKLIKITLLLLCLPIIAKDNLTDLEINFEKIFFQYGDCNEEYINFTESELLIKDYLSKDVIKNEFEYGEITQFDLDIFTEIVQTFCTPKAIFKNATLNLQKILDGESDNKDFLLSIHLHLMPLAFVLYEAEKIEDVYEALSNIFSIVSDNLSKLKINNNWGYSVVSLYNSILYGSVLEFSERYQNNYFNQNYQNFLLYQSLEFLILNSLNSSLSDKSLLSLAEILMESRLRKIEENRYFGTSEDEYLMKEEFFNLYLNKYSDGKIKYTEFSNILSLIDEPYIKIDISLDLIDSLSNLIVDKKSSILTSETEIKFAQQIFQILSEKFDENPTEVIQNSLMIGNLISSKQIDTCPFADKNISKENNLDYFSNVATLNLYKFACYEDMEFFKKTQNELLKGLGLIEDNSVSFKLDSDTAYFIEEVLILSMILYETLSNRELFELKDDEIKISYELAETALKKVNESSVDYADGFLYLGLFETYSLILKEFSEDKINYKERSENFVDTVLQKFPIDPIAIKNKFTDLTENFDSDNMNDIFMTARFASWYLKVFIQKYYSEEMYLWPEEMSKDLTKLSKDDPKLKDLLNNLQLLSYIIDNIDNLFKGPDYFLFIFKDQSLDKWYLFRELVPIEIYLNYALFISDKISFEEYLLLSEKRTNQLLKIRPNNIALQKFREDLIESDFHQPIKQILIDYNFAHKEYIRQKNIQYILNSDTQEYLKKTISKRKYEMKFKLLDLEERLFSKEFENILPTLFSFESHDLRSLQDSIKDGEIILSPIMSPDGMLGYVNYITKENITVLPIFEPIKIYSNFLIDKYKNPNSDNFLWTASSLYYNLLSPIEEVFGMEGNKYSDIFIVPDSSMQDLPFHALFDSNENTWSIEKYNFKYLSSEKLYFYLDDHVISRNQKFVGIGNPSLNKKTIKSEIKKYLTERSEIGINNIKELYELPETEAELINISNFFNSKLLFFQEDATEGLVYREYVKNSDVMAFATHTVRGLDVNNSYNDRGLVFTPGYFFNNSDEDGFIGSLDISDLDLSNNPFVMLSACNTIDSPYYESLPFYGLPKSFMDAGANSVLSSLWNIDSISAKKFNETIFDKNVFIRSFNLSKSIQSSMIYMINSEEYHHPYYWAPYTYFGK